MPSGTTSTGTVTPLARNTSATNGVGAISARARFRRLGQPAGRRLASNIDRR